MTFGRNGTSQNSANRTQKRPADVIGNAVRVMRIAIGEEEEELPADDKNAAAKEPGSKGGKKRAANLSSERRAEIARKAAEKRWAKDYSPCPLSSSPSNMKSIAIVSSYRG